MTTNATSRLEALGFSEYEARAYLTLLQGGSQTGYQLAKTSGIPRPNIYPILARLEQRGAVNKVETKGAAQYSALSSAQMIENAERTFSAQVTRARQALLEVEESQTDDRIWNVDGYDRVLDRARGVVDSAQERLLLGVWSNESARLAANVAEAEKRGVDVTTLCVQGCPDECGGCRGRLYRYDLESSTEPRSLVVVRDRIELLVGQCYADGSAQGAVTTMRAFVSVATQFLENTVAVAEIARSVGPNFLDLLDEDARYAVRRAGVRLNETPWLQPMLESYGRKS